MPSFEHFDLPIMSRPVATAPTPTPAPARIDPPARMMRPPRAAKQMWRQAKPVSTFRNASTLPKTNLATSPSAERIANSSSARFSATRASPPQQTNAEVPTNPHNSTHTILTADPVDSVESAEAKVTSEETAESKSEASVDREPSPETEKIAIAPLKQLLVDIKDLEAHEAEAGGEQRNNFNRLVDGLTEAYLIQSFRRESY